MQSRGAERALILPCALGSVVAIVALFVISPPAIADSITLVSGNAAVGSQDQDVTVADSCVTGSVPATVVAPYGDYWAGPISGTQWDSVNSGYDGCNETFATELALPAAAIAPTITLSDLADNSSNVSLNANAPFVTGNVSGQCETAYSAPPVSGSTTSGFVTGTNTLTFDVDNCYPTAGESPTGIDFVAVVTYGTSGAAVPSVAAAYEGRANNTTYGEAGSLSLSNVQENPQGQITGEATWGGDLGGDGPFVGTISGASINFVVVSSAPNSCDQDGCVLISFSGTTSQAGGFSGTYTVYTGSGAPEEGTWQLSTGSTSSGSRRVVDQTTPRVSGRARVGGTLECASGRWSRTPSRVTYRWVAEGRPIPGAATKLIRVRSVVEGTRVACITTPYFGSTAGTPVTSKSVYVSVPVVSGCPGASRTLPSLLSLLGLERSSVARRLAASSDSGQLLEDEFCLTPVGLLVGYPPASLLGSLSGGARGRFAGRVVWVSTANRYYSIAGVGPGASLSSAKRLLTLTGPYRLGGETWYLARDGRYVVVLIVRGGVIWQLGVSDWPLGTGSAASSGLLRGLDEIYRQSRQISGPLQALDAYWSAIGQHAFLHATNYVRPGVLGSVAAFVRSEHQEDVRSAQFEGQVISESGSRARVRIVSLITHDRRYGCRSWQGTYTLARTRAGHWQITQADIKPRSCT